MQTPAPTRTWPSLLAGNGFIFLLLPLLWALAYLPQLQSRDLFHEEGRRAEPAQEMLHTGNWIVPKIYHEPYLNKPPLFFWLAAALGKIQGHVTELSVRIPSVLSALLGAWLILLFAPKQLSRQTRALAALIFLSTPTMLDKGTLGEIDAFLSLLTFISFTALWYFYDPDKIKIRLPGWIISGLAMGISVLAKGPGGPIEFYAIFIPFLLLARRGHWKILFSPGHILMIIIAAVPLIFWIYALLTNSPLEGQTIVYQWADQLGLRALFKTPAAFPGQKEPSTIHWSHFAIFPIDILGMLAPWSLLAIFPILPKIARNLGWLPDSDLSTQHSALPASPALLPTQSSPNLWLLLAVSGPALLFVFWAYPMAFARHAMMIAYPVSILVALFISSLPGYLAKKTMLLEILRTIAGILLITLAVIALAAIPVVLILISSAAPTTCIVAVLTLAIAFVAFRRTLKTPLEFAPVAAAASLAVLMILGRGVVASVFNPYKARTDSARIFHDQIDAIVPNDAPIFTTRTLLSGNGNNYFNIQFYLPKIPQAIDNFTDIQKSPNYLPGKKVIVILAKSEWLPFQKFAPNALKLGTLTPKSNPDATPPLIVAEAIWPIPPATLPPATAHQ